MSHITSFLALKATHQAVVLQLRRNAGDQNSCQSEKSGAGTIHLAAQRTGCHPHPACLAGWHLLGMEAVSQNPIELLGDEVIPPLPPTLT